MKRLIRSGILLAMVGAVVLTARPMPTEAQGTPCFFTLGFRLLRDMIPDVVGDCIENEWHNPYNGDGLQRTTRGLMVWRKIDNWTAFTDGYTTWINGPFGLQARLNTERFSWEPVAAPVPAPPPPGEPGGTTGGGAGGGTTTSDPTPAPNAAPSIDIDLSDDDGYAGETFTIRLEAEDADGIESMWWWATSTDDNDLRDTHTVNCRGASPCRRSWDLSTTDEGTIRFHAVARDTKDQQSEEVVEEIRIRAPRTSATPTPTSTTR